jgi:hypothetical protein
VPGGVFRAFACLDTEACQHSQPWAGLSECVLHDNGVEKPDTR